MRKKGSRPEKIIFFLVFLAFCLMTVLSCRLYNLKKDLNPEDKEFLSIVRYIISKEERKDFLELPDSEKEKFKEEFWRIRNPDPDSEWNEFKEQYFDRIEEANRLFRGGIPGWLQDRGRIYILFGPPTERSIYPMQSSSKPMEVWLYGSFPVIFVDEMGTGDFKLVTLNVVHLFELNKAQMASQMDPRPKEKFFDFQLSTKKIEGRGILVTIEIDLKNLWLIEREGRLETSFELSVEVLDTNDAKVWEDEKDYPFSILEEDLEKEEKFVIEYPLILERGKYTLNLSLLNKAGEKTIRKSLKIEI